MSATRSEIEERRSHHLKRADEKAHLLEVGLGRDFNKLANSASWAREEGLPRLENARSHSGSKSLGDAATNLELEMGEIIRLATGIKAAAKSVRVHCHSVHNLTEALAHFQFKEDDQ